MRKIFAIAFLSAGLILTGLGCSGSNSTATTAGPVTLNYWRVFDGQDSFDQVISAYQSAHPNVVINYRRFRAEEYKAELIRAFAEGRGPDIFTVHNTELAGYQTLMSPMPDQITTTQQEKRNSFSSQTITVPITKPTLSTRDLHDRFVDQVANDIVLPVSTKTGTANKMYGLPLALDSMALYYNKDLLNSAGIPTAPKNWQEFQDQVIKLTRYDSKGNIIQAGAAIGSPDNIDRVSDVLSAIMMQVGVKMVDDRNQISFANKVEDGTGSYSAAINALNFFNEFSNKGKQVYTWDAAQPDALQAFSNGKVAFYFGYAYDAPVIRAAAPRLNFSVAKFPQVGGDVAQAYFANYWVEGIAASSKYKDWAWDFLLFATSEDQASKYLQSSQKPTAHKGLISKQVSDEFLGPFAEQLLLSRSWYHGKDDAQVDTALKDLIRASQAGSSDINRLIQNTERKIQQSY